MKKLFICLMLLTFIACKPVLPMLKDYKDKPYVCYLADKCSVLNSYKETNQDCTILYQKCFRYIDKEQCGEDEKCYSRVQIKI